MNQTIAVDHQNLFKQFANWLASSAVESVAQIAPGEGAIIRTGERLVAVYRNLSGRLETLSAACPILGGAVRWNKSQKMWECPCHGSVFNCHGEMINESIQRS